MAETTYCGIASAPATEDGHASWFDQVWDGVASSSFEVVGMQALSAESVCMKVALPESAGGCCKVVALTEGNDGEFFVTLKRVAPLLLQVYVLPLFGVPRRRRAGRRT